MNVKKAFFLIFVANSGNLAAYLFQVLSARTMSPGDYGLFNALNSLVMLVSAPIPVGCMLVAKMTIEVSSIDERLMVPWKNFLFKKSLILATGIGGAGLLALSWLQEYFHLSFKTPLYILIANAALVVLIPVFLGMLQGLRFYLMQAWGLALFSWGRLVSGGGLALDGRLTVSEALFCGLLGTILAAFASGFFLEYSLEKSSGNSKVDFWPILRRELGSSFPRMALTYFLVALFLNADMILARHYLSTKEVGLYAVAAILGRIAFYLPGILVAVLFAESVRRSAGRNLLKIGILAGLASFSFGGLCWLAPEFLISLLMGTKYMGAAPYLRVIALGMSFLALANLVFTYFLGQEKYGYLYGLMFCAVFTFGAILIKFHRSPLEIALTLTVGALVAWLWAIGILWWNDRRWIISARFFW